MNIKPIHTAEDYELALQRIEDIFDAEPSSPDADELEVLSILVEDYENKNFPIDLPSPLAAIEFRMDQLGMKQNDLARILGSRSHTSEILSGKRSLSINQIRILHRELGIPTSILIGDGDPVV